MLCVASGSAGSVENSAVCGKTSRIVLNSDAYTALSFPVREEAMLKMAIPSGLRARRTSSNASLVAREGGIEVPEPYASV